MIALAWPLVALCFAAVLWRGLDLMVRALRDRTYSYAHRADLAALRGTTTAVIEGALERLQAVEDEQKNIRQVMPDSVQRVARR